MANQNKTDIGLIGLAVMGENLALNMESKGWHVSVYNRTVPGCHKREPDKYLFGRGHLYFYGEKISFVALSLEYKRCFDLSIPLITQLCGRDSFPWKNRFRLEVRRNPVSTHQVLETSCCHHIPRL